MFPPFNRIGGARGPNGTTLDDVKAAVDYGNGQLFTINAWLEGVFNRMTEMNGHLEKLAGTGAVPNGWTGLPDYLFRFLGGAAPGDSVTTIRDLLRFTIAQQLTSINYIIGNPAAVTDEYQLAVAIEQYISEQQTRAVDSFNIGAMEASLGSLGEAPANQTIKALLEAIRVEQVRAADCCEENGESNPGTVNPAPTFGCGPRIRNIGWKAKGITINNQTTYRIWSPVWLPTSFASNSFQGYPNSDGHHQVFGTSLINKRADVCISWNFEGTDVPFVFGRDIVSTQAVALASEYINGPGLSGGANLANGGLVTETDTCSGSPTSRWIAFNFAFVEGTTPSNNVFIGWTDRACAS